MDEYVQSTYGDRIAPVYDTFTSRDPAPAVEFLAARAGPGPVLEVGIGTGRVALPFAELGVEIHGVDVSERMLAELRQKDERQAISVWSADFLDFDPPTTYSLVYMIYNTITEFASLEGQIACVRKAAQCLGSDGILVVESYNPLSYDNGQRFRIRRIATDAVHLGVQFFDRITRVTIEQHVVLSEQGVDLYPVRTRYLLHSELDLIAELAGLTLRERVRDWSGAPFDGVTFVATYSRS